MWHRCLIWCYSKVRRCISSAPNKILAIKRTSNHRFFAWLPLSQAEHLKSIKKWTTLPVKWNTKYLREGYLTCQKASKSPGRERAIGLNTQASTKALPDRVGMPPWEQECRRLPHNMIPIWQALQYASEISDSTNCQIAGIVSADWVFKNDWSLYQAMPSGILNCHWRTSMQTHGWNVHCLCSHSRPVGLIGIEVWLWSARLASEVQLCDSAVAFQA